MFSLIIYLFPLYSARDPFVATVNTAQHHFTYIANVSVFIYRRICSKKYRSSLERCAKSGNPTRVLRVTREPSGYVTGVKN